MPCGGGISFQKINRARGVGTEKLSAHWRDFFTLWGNVEIGAKEVVNISGVVVVEWPEVNDYWQQPSVSQFSGRHEFSNSIFHGCACGLVSKYGPCPGVAVEKSWRGSSNNPICSHTSTESAPIKGKLTTTNMVITGEKNATERKIIPPQSSTPYIRSF
jgi:hypothetical protein